MSRILLRLPFLRKNDYRGARFRQGTFELRDQDCTSHDGRDEFRRLLVEELPQPIGNRAVGSIAPPGGDKLDPPATLGAGRRMRAASP
jgi:hypothetical protein